MSLRDLHNNINVKPAFYPVAAITDNTAAVSTIVDRAGYHACELVIITGTESDADATFTVLFEDGDAANLSDHAETLITLGTEALASFTFADDQKCFKIGYAGTKRYCRATITPANNTGNFFVAGAWILGGATTVPTPNPPA